MRKLFLGYEWEQYMVSQRGMTPGTARTYVSYLINFEDQYVQQIDKLCQKDPGWPFGELGHFDIIPLLFHTDINELISMLQRLAGSLSANLLGLPSTVTLTVSPKTIKNWLSAINCYIDFLNQLPTAPAVHLKSKAWFLNPLTKVHSNVLGILYYPFKHLFGTFRNRILTQDRYTGVYFPIRLIRKIFENSPNPVDKKWFDNWVKHCIDNISVLTKNKVYRLIDVEYIEIDQSHNVYARLKGGQRERVYTHTANGKIRPMKATSLCNISLDHCNPISNSLRNPNGWKALPYLKNEIDNWCKANGVSPCQSNTNKIANGVFYSIKVNLFPLIPGLKYDLDRLCQKAQCLELMEAKENYKKNDSIKTLKIERNQ